MKNILESNCSAPQQISSSNLSTDNKNFWNIEYAWAKIGLQSRFVTTATHSNDTHSVKFWTWKLFIWQFKAIQLTEFALLEISSHLYSHCELRVSRSHHQLSHIIIEQECGSYGYHPDDQFLCQLVLITFRKSFYSFIDNILVIIIKPSPRKL